MTTTASAGARSFVKMHGLGNDFAIFDARRQPLSLVPEQVRLLAHRRLGIGCDQLIVIEAAEDADASLCFFNADGSGAGACGNGTRCVAALLFAERPRREVRLQTASGLLCARSQANGLIEVDMGAPRFAWSDIPLARDLDTLYLPLREGPLAEPSAVSMGNPHLVFFVAEDAAIDLAVLGPRLEHHPLLPERANISVARVRDRGHIRLDVWERGAGLTLACGTAACAAAVAAARRNLTDRTLEVRLPGGTLQLDWGEDGHVRMTGPVAVAYMGMVEVPAIAGLEAAS
ncbi:MAG: diaminopimelate epimerase [Pseudomonadota bacterium]